MQRILPFAKVTTRFPRHRSVHLALPLDAERVSHTRIVNSRRAFAARVTVVGSVCLSVCLSVCACVRQHLTSRASVRPVINITYSTGNEGLKICGVFSETASLRRSSPPSVVRPYVQAAIFHARAFLYLRACTYRLALIRAYTYIYIPAHAEGLQL